MLMVANEMKEWQCYSLGQDAGHRAELEHLVKMISYPPKDKNGDLRIKNFCFDITSCGKTIEEVADGIGVSLRILYWLVTAGCSSVTEDEGGSGAILHIIKKLVVKGHVLNWAKHIRCLLHVLNKCFEQAIQGSMGKQGLGTNSCIRLLYSSISMLQKIIADEVLVFYDKYHNIVVEGILSNPD